MKPNIPAKLIAKDVLQHLLNLQPGDRVIYSIDRYNRASLRIDDPDMLDPIRARAHAIVRERRGMSFQFAVKSESGNVHICEMIVGATPASIYRLEQALERVPLPESVRRK